MSFRSSPTVELTRHFFREFFYLGFLTEAGADSLLRLIVSVLAGLMSLGIFLPMLFFQKYTRLAQLTDPQPYRQAILGDQLFVLCVAMFIVALVGTVVSQSLFPNETDFRILIPLPVTRRTVFGAKLLALGVLAAMFVIATNFATGPVFPAATSGRWAREPLIARMTAHTAASLLASSFALASVLSIQGFVAVLMPRKWLRPASVTAQTATVCALMLCLPFITRASALGALIDSHARWWYAIPPAWFVGVEQVLLGSSHEFFVRLAYIGLGSTVFCLVSIGVCYVVVYRRFDQIILRTSHAPSPARPEWLPRLAMIGTLHPAEAAIVEFLLAGLRRSRLHQLVFLGTSAVALAIATHSLFAVSVAELFAGDRPMSREVVFAANWASFLVVFVAVRALRDSLLLPLEIRASWIFRMTEDNAIRPRQLDAVRRVLFALGVVPGVALFFPAQIVTGGFVRASCWAVLTLLLGHLLVDVTLKDWRSIPFTCAYAPGKRHVMSTVSLTLVMFLAFVGIGTVAVHTATATPWSFLVWLLVLSGALAHTRQYRRRTWGRLPLEFEDTTDDLQRLRLSER